MQSREELWRLGGFKKGELNPIIESQYGANPKVRDSSHARENGFEIFKVEEHQKQGQADLSEVENENHGQGILAANAAPSCAAFSRSSAERFS